MRRRGVVAELDGQVGGEHVRLQPALEAPYVACNPCVIPDGAGYLVNCRAVNYRQRDARDDEIFDEQRIVRTRSVLMALTADLESVSERTLYGEMPPPRASHVAGFEDLRLFHADGALFAVATTLDRRPSGRCGPSLLRLDPDGRVVHHVPLVGYGCERDEKNWLPYVDDDGRARIRYAFDPHVVLLLDLESGACRPLAERTPTRRLGRWRNSAGPVACSIDGRRGRLYLVHECLFMPEHRRRYVHRFVWHDAADELLLATKPFVFRHVGIEFAAGMCLDPSRSTLLVSYGVEDREAWLARIPLEDAIAGLLPLPAAPATG